MRALGYIIALLVFAVIMTLAIGGNGVLLALLGLSILGGVMTHKYQVAQEEIMQMEDDSRIDPPTPDEPTRTDSTDSTNAILKELSQCSISNLRNQRKQLLQYLQDTSDPRRTRDLSARLDCVRAELKDRENTKKAQSPVMA